MKNTLTREQFITAVKEEVSLQLGNEYQVNLHQVPKNNSKPLIGLIINQSDEDWSPIIHLDNFFDEYQQGKALEIIIEEIVYTVKHCSVLPDVKNLMQFSSISDRIVMKLVNYDQNQELLSVAPHRKILDLAVVPYILLHSNAQGHASVPIWNKHLELWDVTIDEVFARAVENCKHLLPACIQSLGSSIRKMLGDITDEFSEDALMQNPAIPMYVLTNQNQLHGAVCCLYKNVLKQFAVEQGADIIIMPSSVHEVILLPKSNELDSDFLRDIVREVNEVDVLPEELLSNNIYLYERESGIIRIVE